MGRLRVALYHHLPPGGAARAMEELAARSSADIEHVVFQVDPGPRDRHAGRPVALAGLGLETHTVTVKGGRPGRLSEWAVTVPRILRAERRIAAMIDSGDFDAVVVHHQRHTHAPHLLECIRTPSVYFVHEPRRQSFEYDMRPRGNGHGIRLVISTAAVRAADELARRHDIRATRAATELLCNSEHTREYIWRAYGRDAVVVPLGVDLDHFTPRPGQGTDIEPGRHEPGARRSEVLMVAALERPKGLDLGVRAIASIAVPDRPTIRIVHNRADPTFQHELLQLASALNVELTLERGLSDDDLVARYQGAALCLLTSRLEPLGLTAIEAGACGIPVVAVREGGYRETVADGVTGLLTDRDPDAVGAAISRVLAGNAGLNPLRIRARIEADRHWSTAVERYLDVVRRTAGC